MVKITKNRYLLGFAAMVVLLAVVRLIWPDVARPNQAETVAPIATESLPAVATSKAAIEVPREQTAAVRYVEGVPRRIWSVANYQTAFPDSQAVQLQAAERWGVSPVRNRVDAEQRMQELVYVGSSPYYHVDPLYSSIPYLVPRAAVLLQDIGKAFFDSLYVKGVPLNQLIVTSVLRSQDDVEKLRRKNGNATDNSCHLYGTTFDICYNRYHAVTQPVRNDTLKWVLSEVLRDMRQQQRCYIKYEVKQGCFHMTVR